MFFFVSGSILLNRLAHVVIIFKLKYTKADCPPRLDLDHKLTPLTPTFPLTEENLNKNTLSDVFDGKLLNYFPVKNEYSEYSEYSYYVYYINNINKFTNKIYNLLFCVYVIIILYLTTLIQMHFGYLN